MLASPRDSYGLGRLIEQLRAAHLDRNLRRLVGVQVVVDDA